MEMEEAKFGRGSILLYVAPAALLFLLPELLQPFSFDNNLNHAMGWLLAGFGRLPCVGSWDQNLPTINYIHAGVIWLFGVSEVPFHAVDILANVILASLLAILVARYHGRLAGLIAGMLYPAMYALAGYWMAGQRDGFASLLIIGGVLLYLSTSETNRVLRLFGVGFMLGMAATLRPTLGLCLVAVLLCLRIYDRDARWSGSFAMILGSLAALLAVLLPYFWQSGALTQCYDAVIRYNAEIYATAKWRRPLFTALTRPQELLCDGIFFVWMASRWRSSPKVLHWKSIPKEVFLFSALYLAAKLSIVVMGKYYIQHYHTLLVLSVVLVATMGPRFSQQKLSHSRIKLVGIAGFIVLLAIIYGRSRVPALAGNILSGRGSSLTTLYSRESNRESERDLEESSLSEYLLSKGVRGKCIEVWGLAPSIYWRTETYASSRFTTLQPLVMLGPSEQLATYQLAWQREFVDSMRHSPPLYIVIEKRADQFQDFVRHPAAMMVDSIQGFRGLLDSNYNLESARRDWDVYALHANASR